ncbi:monocarboxylate transporter 9 [Neodiprion virginianus]|uniref:monocarboxylate transporter 9 n=1 Tax=Neodiprion virginianus TaxID=2961670 RepID=UPI001EE69F1F|nr:monocarboxylate transporter 9 [Neodiprion virginianus]
MTMTQNVDGHRQDESKKEIASPLPQRVLQPTAEELAPDGGWGWMVAAGTAISYIVCLCPTSSLGLVYGDFLETTGSDGSALTLMNAMFMFSFSFAGLFCNELLKRHNIRHVAVCGAMIFSIANLATIFIPNVPYLAACFFIQGMGVGMVLSIINTSMNAYFVKRRALVMTAQQVVVGFGAIFYPSLIEYFLRTYGFRGCLTLLAGLSFHAILGMFTISPVENHFKKPKIIRHKPGGNVGHVTNFKSSGNNDILMEGKKIIPIERKYLDDEQGWEKNKSVPSLKVELENEKPLLIDRLKAPHRSEDHVDSDYDIENGCHFRKSKGSTLDMLSNQIPMITATSVSSMPGIGAFGDVGHSIADMTKKNESTEKKTILSILGNFFEVSLLHDHSFVNICTGMSFIFVSDLTFGSFVPIIMANGGYNKQETALALTAAAIAELVSRVALVVFAMFFKVKARNLVLGATYALLCGRLAFLYCTSLIDIVVVMSFSGLARSWFLVPQPLVLAEHFCIEKFSAAYGLFSVINGCLTIFISPATGFVKDWTGSYVIAQYMLIGVMLLGIIPWTIELLAHKYVLKQQKAGIATGN